MKKDLKVAKVRFAQQHKKRMRVRVRMLHVHARAQKQIYFVEQVILYRNSESKTYVVTPRAKRMS